jgi:hypothetical protein
MRQAISIAALLVIIGFFAHLDWGGQTNSWPEAPCQIIDSRVVPRTVYTPPTFALYKGEYELRYNVNEREYNIWADAVDWNEDRQFVQSSISAPPQPCPYTVRYNRAAPSEAVATVNSN